MNSISPHLPCYLSKGPLKQDFLGIYLTTNFWVPKVKNKSSMRVIFFQKCSKLSLNLENVKKNSENIFGFLDNCIYEEENTCHWKSMGYQTLLRFFISPRETISTLTVFTEITKYGNGAAFEISTVFRSVYHVTCRRVLINFLELYLKYFEQVQKYISYEGHLFFENIENSI